MSCYQHILLAADFTKKGSSVAEKAKQLAENNQAQLSLIHVVDNPPIADAGYGPIIPMGMDFTDDLIASAKKRLIKLADKLGIEEKKQWLEVGSPKLEIVRVAEENNVDLIIVGSHGKHGFALLLGSTANGVLHHAKCDVLAVRIHDD
jgi:universal stress protein A